MSNKEVGFMKKWITSLKTRTPQEGFELAITLAQKGVEYTQPSEAIRSEEHTSELQSRFDIVCRLLLLCAPCRFPSFPTRRSSDLSHMSISFLNLPVIICIYYEQQGGRFHEKMDHKPENKDATRGV